MGNSKHPASAMSSGAPWASHRHWNCISDAILFQARETENGLNALTGNSDFVSWMRELRVACLPHMLVVALLKKCAMIRDLRRSLLVAHSFIISLACCRANIRRFYLRSNMCNILQLGGNLSLTFCCHNRWWYVNWKCYFKVLDGQMVLCAFPVMKLRGLNKFWKTWIWLAVAVTIARAVELKHKASLVAGLANETSKYFQQAGRLYYSTYTVRFFIIPQRY